MNDNISLKEAIQRFEKCLRKEDFDEEDIQTFKKALKEPIFSRFYNNLSHKNYLSLNICFYIC